VIANAAPRVSVIIPCYNLGRYVGEAVESVLAQTVQDFEILVVDDGSTDRHTQQLLASPPWPGVTVFRTPNGGVGRARNFLIERARGSFLCALDADDRLHPEYFERTLAAFARDQSLTFVSTHMQMFGDDDRRWPPDARCDLAALLVDDPVFCAALVRRAAVVAAGGYDTGMPAQGNEDWDLWIRLLEAGGRGTILPEVLFYYRRRRGSMCDECTSGETHLASMEYLFRKHWASYATHADFVERCKSARLDAIRRVNDRLEDDVRLLARRAEQLQRRQAEQGELRALREECTRARAEVEALRSSASWKLAAPLRFAYDWLHRRQRPRSG
jgi:glycosyltransferase involved in cell wall biosynthesis